MSTRVIAPESASDATQAKERSSTRGTADLDPARAALSMAPFAGAALLAWIVVIVANKIDWPDYAVASGLLLITGALPLVGPRRLRPGGVPAALTFLASVAMLRSAGGGVSSGAAGLAVIPVFYTALYGSRRELALVVVATAIFYVMPIIVIGGTSFPHSQYRGAVVSSAVIAIVGVATYRLVASVRREARESRRREQMLEQVSDAVQHLFGSSQAREDVCEAIRTVGDASVAVLFEPDSAGTLCATAVAGVDGGPERVTAGHKTAVGRVFASGVPALVTQDVVRSVGSLELWEASGSPGSVLYEPLLKESQTIGVLVVGWPTARDATGGRLKVVALLAHEAAAVLDRADRLNELADKAHSDPLTGLPNRRAWDERIETAIGEHREMIVAMLDLDHFKQFNDNFGHPAGDRLLKEAAAKWREQLRAGDLLARLGGEEFGLLLLNCDTSQAIEVVERLRESVPQERTCSAGYAVRYPGESADSVLARADEALYEAKSAGRNRTQLAAPPSSDVSRVSNALDSR